jgi:DNA-binding response OmpR family regulator
MNEVNLLLIFKIMKKILLIEDNKEISDNIANYLELENFEVTKAFD